MRLLTIAKSIQPFLRQEKGLLPISDIYLSLFYDNKFDFLRKMFGFKDLFSLVFISDLMRNMEVTPQIAEGIKNNIYIFSVYNFENLKTQRSCSTCGGSGEITCSECNGGGQVNCSDCDGRGQVDCSECGGSGETEDEEPCDECQGEGLVDCDNCHLGEVSCYNCNDGYESCYECLGSGEEEADGPYIPFELTYYVSYKSKLKENLLKYSDSLEPLSSKFPPDAIKIYFRAFDSDEFYYTELIDEKFQNNIYVGEVIDDFASLINIRGQRLSLDIPEVPVKFQSN